MHNELLHIGPFDGIWLWIYDCHGSIGCLVCWLSRERVN